MKIKKTADIETGLKRLAEIDKDLAEIELTANRTIDNAKTKAEEESRSLTEERQKLIGELKEFSDNHRDELYEDGMKSRDFVNGSIGYRKSPDKVVVSKETAELLCAAGFKHCVKITKEPVKAALKNFGKDQLAEFKVSLIPGEETFYANASEKTIPA